MTSRMTSKALILLAALAAAASAQSSAVSVERRGTVVSLSNSAVSIRYDLARGQWEAIEKSSGRSRVQGAVTLVNTLRSDAPGAARTASEEPVADALGIGKSLLITTALPKGPALLLRLTLYPDSGSLALTAGLLNSTQAAIRVKTMSPMSEASAFPGESHAERYSVLDGNGGGAPSFVSHEKGIRKSLNNLLVTFGPPGSNRSLVAGGLTYDEFEKYAEANSTAAQLRVRTWAEDPVGKLVDPGVRYLPADRFYLDFTTRNPFEALERYAESVRLAQGIVLPVCDFPIVDTWFTQVDHFGGGMDRNAYKGRNDSLGAVEEMEAIARSGFLKYSRAAVLLEPDLYDPNNQQGWWDDEHWQRGPDVRAKGFWKNNSNGQFVAPYQTASRWAGAVRALGGIPMIYVQTGFRSQDYAEAFPQHMLFNQPNVPHLNEKGEQQYRDKEKKVPRKLGYDYTDPGFIAHMREVWERLRLAGIQGVKFDYPDYPFTGWPVTGGMEDPYSTTAMHYRSIFRLARQGLGPGSYLHERTLARGSDVTLGLVASQRTEGDTDLIDAKMVTRLGLRWYKNRALVNYDMDGKNPFHAQPPNRDGERAMLTMSYVVSGTLMLVPSFGRLSAGQVHDISRLFPYHPVRRSARPVDAFIRELPRIYDYRIDAQWHQVAFFNFDTAQPAEVSVALAGDTAFGALGLDASRQYYVYDFWNSRLAGKLSGKDSLAQTLRPGEARMMSVHEVAEHPQFLSTNRHLMQGYTDLLGCTWNASKRELEGVSAVVGGEAYKVIIATNGFQPKSASADDRIEQSLERSTVAGGKRELTVEVRHLPDTDGLAELTIRRADNGPVAWKVVFE